MKHLKKMKRLILYNFFSLFLMQGLSAQPLLTLEEAIDIALDKNYGIQISKNNLEVAANNATKGNAGYWPTIDLNAGGGFNWNTFSNQKLATGNDFNLKNQTTTLANGNVALSWTIFDGKRMFAAYERLQELQSMGELQVKAAVEQTVYDVSLSYFNIVSLQLQLDALDKNIGISEERLKLEKARFEVGKSNQLAAKQAQLDYNAMQAQRSTLTNLINVEKVSLNRLLTREIETEYTIADTIILQELQDLESLKQAALKSNTELQILEKATIISEAGLKEVKADKYPTITLNTAYGYNQTINSAGFSQSTNSLGLTSGVTMRWNLFDGGRVRRNIANAQLQIDNDKLTLQESQLNVNAAIQQAVFNFENALSIAKLEDENYRLASESLDIVKERFRLGVANTLELKDAQNVFDQSTNRRALALYNAKVAEINLQFLTGQLAVQ